MLKSQKEISDVKDVIRNAGFMISSSPARAKFQPQEGLELGVYTPLITGTQPAVLVPRRNSASYEAIPFRAERDGKIVKISLSGIYNSIRIVTGANPESLGKDAVWLGEDAQPTKSFFRYGKLSDMLSDDMPDEDSSSGTIGLYEPMAFTLTTKVVYVLPKFSAANKPYYEAGCQLRTALCADDYLSYPDENAQR